MLPNRTYNGLLDARLDANGMREAALMHAQMSTSRAKKVNLQMSTDRKLLYGVYKRAGGELPRALEVFADNFYVLEKALTATENLERLRLPAMLHGEHMGLPRVYDVAACIAGHRDGKLDEGVTGRFISAYQETAPLEMREISALTAMLRAATIKLVSLECTEAAEDMKKRDEAAAAAQQLLKQREKGKRIALLQKLELSQNAACAERLYAILSEQDAREQCSEVAEQLRLEDADIDGLFQRVRERQARIEERMENAIKSLRSLDALDEERFFEEHSRTDALLRRDDTYCRMDARSRAYYRASVERLASRLGAAETVIARQATTLALEGEGRAAEAGWYLFMEGRERLYAALRPDKRYKRQSESGKMAAFAAVTAVLSVLLILLAAYGGAAAALLAVLPAWNAARAIAVRLFIRGAFVREIPRIATEQLDGRLKTIVVIPTLITDGKGIRSAVEQMETHMLASRGVSGVYAVLGDFSDTDEQQKSGERELMRLGVELTEELNKKYSSDVPRFYYLHRRREYAQADGVFMGRERKRGALCDMIELISSGDMRPFAIISHPLPEGLEYCVTLDADTLLPPGALGELVGCVEHPLNAPEVTDGMVTAGYGVIAPRMVTLPRSAEKSRFASIVSGETGLDAYFPACAEFYQDVFGTGLFGGKGIFSISAFHETAAQWIAPNTILSHDMLEGCFLRAGFAGDITLFDGEPASIIAWWKRQHRWTRGDWQLLPFLANGLTDASGARRTNPLSMVSKMKIFDNLRRSLVIKSIPYSIILLPWIGFGWYAALAFLPLVEGVLTELLSLPSRIRATRDADTWGMISDIKRPVYRAALSLAELPYAALKTSDAIIRSLWRTLVSHRHMLEWQTAAQTQGKPKSIAGYYKAMWIEPLFGAIMVAFAALGLAPVYSLSLGLLWLAMPLIARYHDSGRRNYEFTDAEKDTLMAVARGAWEYFSTFSTAQRNYLPPDNFQQSPERPPAIGTSPTNIGMGLMAAVSAMELGIVDDEEAAGYIERVTETVERMEKWHGNLFNWYRTDTLEVLRPRYVSTVDSGNFAASAMTVATVLRHKGRDQLAARLAALAGACDLSALYDAQRKLFCIGYDAETCELSRSWYDLMASEARLTSLVAIAMGQAELKHWFRLGRPMAAVQGQTLASWSGTMFEYLMPLIFTGAVPDTLLYESCKNAVRAQRRAAGGRPWGISESGYYAFDRNMYYQYRAFGLQKLSLSNRREPDTVVSPYSTLLALMVDRSAAVKNVAALGEEGAMGLYGMYEALDYTPSRLGEGHRSERVQSYMAHHQGMSICAIANCLCDNVLVRSFFEIPSMRAVRVLTEERTPLHGARVRSIQPTAERQKQSTENRTRPRMVKAQYEVPESQLLSNGSYTVFVTDGGLGFSQCGDVMLSRWRGDSLRGRSGVQVAVYAKESFLATDSAVAALYPHKAEFTRKGDVSSRYEVCVCARRDAELRRLTLTNTTGEPLTAAVGVYMETCLATAAKDASHPGFNDLTTDAELANSTLLMYKRRSKERRQYLYARFSGGEAIYITDMLKAMGRGTTLTEAMQIPLAKPSQGDVSSPVLPCIFARTDVALGAGESTELWFVMGYANSRDEALESCDEILSERRDAFDIAWANANSTLSAQGVECGKAELFERIAARLLINIPQKQCNASQSMGMAALWRFGISGDAPIVLMEIVSVTELRLLRTMIEFQAYYSQRLQSCELVVVGQYPAEYRNELQTRVREMTAGKNVHLINGYELSGAELETLRGVASIAIEGSASLNKLFAPREVIQTKMRQYDAAPVLPIELERPELRFDNGTGGFSSDGEYVIVLEPGQKTPMPWCNVLANDGFGTIVSESGGGHTWSGNSREHKLTPWYDAPVEDRPGEILLLTDIDSGLCFSPFAGRLQHGRTIIRHGYGYSAFESGGNGLRMNLNVFVHAEKKVKFSELTLVNPSMGTRRVSVLYAVEWVLGGYAHPEAIETVREGNIVFAKNLRDRSTEYGYIFVSGAEAESTSVRNEVFLCGWDKELLSETNGTGGGTSALRINVVLQPGETRKVTFILGFDTKEGAKEITKSDPAAELARVRDIWQRRVGGITVKTQDEALNTMMNGRLLYQTLSSRILARSGYYQCGGAIGFRDQLQDMLPLIHTDPARVREHILLCAARQFIAGDVLHWWHMPFRGVRTRIVDDRLFLPYVLDRYVDTSKDTGILDEIVPYLEDAPIPEGRRDLYENMQQSAQSESLYLHCVRAADSIETGAHGLPLMQGGDWNDAMDLVGQDGGESVWLAWFYAETLAAMERLSKIAGNSGERFAARRVEIMRAAEEAGWDGDWYRRAYFANGAPLGSKENAECSIDCLSQAWAAIAGGERANAAMDSMLRLLYDEQEGIIKLLTPPFDGLSEQPVGYISDYVPGIRENGGQYTHAGAWAVMACCKLDRPEQALQLFSMLNPINHTLTHAQVMKYKTEPYAIAGDVYAQKHIGRGGWTWYTGAAAWLYTVCLEEMLGIKRQGDMLVITPCVPFDEYTVRYPYKSSSYMLHIHQTPGKKLLAHIKLEDDGKSHELEVR